MEPQSDDLNITDSPHTTLRRLLPVDTKENLQQAKKHLNRLHDKAVLSARHTMAEGVGAYGRFAVCVSEHLLEGDFGVLRQTVEQLRAACVLADITDAGSAGLAGTAGAGAGGSPVGGLEVPVGSHKTDKVTGWLDDLHECIAVHDYVQAVEAIDRLRFELLQTTETASSDYHKRSLEKYTTQLSQSLLSQLAAKCMDVGVVTATVTLLHHLSYPQQARDTLLSAYTRRIRRLATACYTNADLLAGCVGRALRQSALLFRRAFQEDAVVWSGVVVWLEAHVLELVQVVEGAVGDHVEAVAIVRRHVDALQRDCNVDLDFVLQ